MRDVSVAVAATLTVLLHLLILFALVRVAASVVNPPPPPAWQERPPTGSTRRASRSSASTSGPDSAARGFACAGSSYVGVGVTAELRTERIMLVGDDTPASRAGLQHDDIVLNPEVWQDAHREGIVLHVTILREGVKMTVPVRVGKICIE